MNSNLPSKLYNQIEYDGIKWVIADGVENAATTLTFHDTMSDNLTITDAGVVVTVDGTVLDINSYYFDVDEDGHGFTVELDVLNLLQYGVIDQYDLLNSSDIVISYTAVVSESAQTGDDVSNEAWVTWDGGESNTDKTPVQLAATPPKPAAPHDPFHHRRRRHACCGRHPVCHLPPERQPLIADAQQDLQRTA